MHEFTCGHQECSSQFSSSDKEYLMRQIAEHVKEAHKLQSVPQTVLAYLEMACITTTPDR